jgi:hypothetical protein
MYLQPTPPATRSIAVLLTLEHRSDDPVFALSLVVRLYTFNLASGQHINIAKSCVVPLGTMPPPPATEAARVDPLTVVASKKCLGVTFAPATA